MVNLTIDETKFLATPELSGATLQKFANLPKEDRGLVRELGDVDIRLSTYSPPFRPGTGNLHACRRRYVAPEAAERGRITHYFYGPAPGGHLHATG